MFENVCTLPLTGALLCQALHPTEPILTVGLYNGRVQSFRLPPAVKPNPEELLKGPDCLLTNGKATIETLWETRRHKKGCRALAYTPDGSGKSQPCPGCGFQYSARLIKPVIIAMFSAGADGIVKHFESATGRVISKAAIPDSDEPSVIYAIDPNHLLVGCDSGALHLYDVRADGLSARPSRSTNPHGDAISSINPVPPFEDEYFQKPSSSFPKQFITTGGSTLAVSDLRNDKVVESEDQEDDLLCATYIPGLGMKGAKENALAVGGSMGVVTLWDRGSWDDQQDRVVISKEESVDAVVAVPAEAGYGSPHGKAVFAATGDGKVTMFDAGRRQAIEGGELRHDDMEGVVAMGFDCFNRLVTGGGKVIKIWEDLKDLQEEGEDDEDSSEDEDEDSDEDGAGKGTKRSREESSDESESDSEEERDRERREKQRKKREAVAARLGPMGAHGVLKFDGLD